MIARAELAVLDFNCGVGVGQAKTKSGKLHFKQQIREPKDGIYPTFNG